MGRLIKAEFRKILTTRLWWALLIPAVLLAGGWAWGWSAVISKVANDATDSDLMRSANVRFDQISWSILALTRSMNIASIFPMVFGGLALASEISRRTITTSFLTAPTRASVLGAKAVTYALWGAIYGVVVAGAASLGILLGSDSDLLPSAGDWMLVLLSGVAICVLWTLLGMGVGALIGSPVGTLVLLLIYAILVGPVSELILTGVSHGSHIAGMLPNGSANGMTGATASDLIFNQVSDLVNARGGGLISQSDIDDFDNVVRLAAGAPGAFSLGISALIFVAWTGLFFGTGLYRNQTRDIT